MSAAAWLSPPRLVFFQTPVHFSQSNKFVGRQWQYVLLSNHTYFSPSNIVTVDLIFHANTESGKTDDLQADPDINLGFLNESGEWASIAGKASIITDRTTVHKYYSPALKAWIGDLGDGKHDGGPDDPRVCVIKVKALTAQYAVSKKTAVGGFVEFAKGVATGSTPNVNKLRYLGKEELEQCK